jgi:hypothetical protein
VVHLDEAAHDGQPYAEPAVRAIQRIIGLGKEVEDAWQRRRLYAPSVVFDLENRMAALRAHSHVDASARGRELRRVVEQVRDHLVKPRRVCANPRRLERG